MERRFVDYLTKRGFNKEDLLYFKWPSDLYYKGYNGDIKYESISTDLKKDILFVDMEEFPILVHNEDNEKYGKLIYYTISENNMNALVFKYDALRGNYLTTGVYNMSCYRIDYTNINIKNLNLL